MERNHLPTHQSDVLVLCSRVGRVYQAPVFDDEIVLWTIKVWLAGLVLEDRPVVAHRLSLIIVNNTMIRQIIGDNLLPLLLTC
jgi:hypothetical protein